MNNIDNNYLMININNRAIYHVNELTLGFSICPQQL